MLKRLKKLLEAGGVDFDIISEPDMEDCDSETLEEELYDVHVRDQKVIKKVRDFGDEYKKSKRARPKDLVVLRKARLKAHTPKTNIDRLKSLIVRKATFNNGDHDYE